MDHEKEYAQLLEQKASIESIIKDIMQDYAEKNCPYNIGEKIEIRGYAYRGRMGIIKEIKGSEKWCCHSSEKEKLGWTVQGIILKKDGTEGTLFFKFNEADNERK